MTKEQTFNDLFREAGLKLEHGVHGNSEWTRVFDDGSKLSVRDDDKTIPTEESLTIVVELYSKSFEPLYREAFPRVQTALAKVKEIIAGYPGEDFEL